MSEDNDSKGKCGCFIVIFLILASGIPAATEGEGPIGTTVVVIIGLVLAYLIAKAMSGLDE